MTKEIKTINKSLIFLKSSVIAMGIVFIVLIFSFILIKQKKSNQKTNDCPQLIQLKVDNQIEKMELQNNNIIILTKYNPRTNTQEIIKIDSNCTRIINHIKLQQ